MTIRVAQVDDVESGDEYVLVRNSVLVRAPASVGSSLLDAERTIKTATYADGGNVVTGYGPAVVNGVSGPQSDIFRFKPPDFSVVRASGAAWEKKPFIEHSEAVWFEPSMIGAVPSSVKIQSATYSLEKQPFIDHSGSVWIEPAMIGAIPSSVKIQSATYNLEKQPFIDHSESVWFEPTMIGSIPTAATVRTAAGIFTKPIFQEVAGVGYVHPDMLRAIPLSALDQATITALSKGRLKNAMTAGLVNPVPLSGSMSTIISISLPLDNTGPRPVVAFYFLQANATRADLGNIAINARMVFGSTTPMADHPVMGANPGQYITNAATLIHSSVLGGATATTATIALQARHVNGTAGNVFLARIIVMEFYPYL